MSPEQIKATGEAVTEQTTDQLQIRWLIRRDMPQVMDIERASFFNHAWTEEEFLSS